ncbi:hypothetical protein K1T71_009687 [Dendrolimus kikuchii]|uniref:Uncharacterized protein n=1 Tax=Dendrolimus kikuchii TaxID=765133 RepID=A0ACC1CT39_9NEOP|nr:hypothetical protein K1T71_009687 [Dendrolimus kikuchii]
MNETVQNKLIRKESSKEVTKDNVLETEDSSKFDDGPSSTRSTYESFFWFFCYTKMFIFRLAKDLTQSALSYFYSGPVLPDHIVNLMRVQQTLREQRESQTVTCSSEDDIGLQYEPVKKYNTSANNEKEQMFVIVDSSGVNNLSSKELLINKNKNATERISRNYIAVNIIQPDDMPSTSKDRNEMSLPQLKESDSDEHQMIDINLQSENEIPCDYDNDNDSIVISYLKNKDVIIDMEEISENSLDAYIPSYPGSPRSLFYGSDSSSASTDDTDFNLKKALEFLHADYELLMAAEIGNDKAVDRIIRKGANIHQVDHVGRNALHLAVCSGNVRAMELLLKAGVKPNVKDNVGMTPLSICLMRRPSFKVASLLFDYGAKVISRSNPMDTGLFLQFLMMCIPTSEEEKIVKLLIKKGALVNDPDAPGGRQALHFAAMSNNCDLIRILVELGADLYVINHRSETPREVAATFNCKEAEALLQDLEDRDSTLAESISVAVELNNSS